MKKPKVGRRPGAGHVETERLMDFLEHRLPETQADTIQRHLADCAPCRRRAKPIEKLLAGLTGRTLESPPDWLRAWAEDLPQSNPRRIRAGALRSLRLVFDTWQMAPAGARSAVTSPRRLVFRADTVDVDIEVDARPGAGRSALRGQLLDAAVPDGRSFPGGEVRLLKGRRVVARGSIDGRGEFHLSGLSAGTYALRMEAGSFRYGIDAIEI